MADTLGAPGVGSSDILRGQITTTSPGVIKAPENIVRTVMAAQAIYYKYRAEHVKRIELYSLIEGLIAGNPPYNPAELMKQGLGHISNFNSLDGRALYERGCLAYWNLLNEAETIVKFTINSEDPEARKYEDIISKEWDVVVRKWPSFETLMGNLSGQLVKFGISPILWSDERDWRWRVIELNKFFIPDQAQSDIEMMTVLCVESMYTAQYLFEVYEHYKDKPKDESPWDIDELAGLLLWTANSFAKTRTEFVDFMDLQRRLQNGDLNYDVIFSDSIRLVSLFYKEYEGGFSHYMFHRTYNRGDFLYFADRQFKKLQDAVVIFTASPGEYTIHSNRGLGHKIFAPCQAMMQLDCATIDMAKLSSTPIIRGISTGSKDVDAIRFYPGVATNIGTAEFVQNQLGANISQLIGASQFMLQKMQFNTANSGDDPSIPDKDIGSISPTQARMKSYKEFAVLKNNIAHYYRTQDQVFQTMTIKMLNSKANYPGYEYAKEWKDRCIEQGVPPEVFAMGKLTPWGMPRQLSVKATRVAGDGSTLARIMGLEELMAISGDFGPKEAREYKRQWIMATMGKEYVSAFMQDPSDTDTTSGGASLAGTENAIMQQGFSPIFSADNNQKAHFATHMALAMHVIEGLQQQQSDPIEADKIFTVLVPHIEQHFSAAARSPFAKVFVEQNKKGLSQVVQYATLNHKNAAKMMQARIKEQQEQQAQQQEVMTDEQLKNIKVQGDEKRADFKINSQVARADRANETRAEVMKEKIVTDSDNQRLKIRLEAENKAKKDSGEASLESLRADLSAINGSTPAPYDIEGRPTKQINPLNGEVT